MVSIFSIRVILDMSPFIFVIVFELSMFQLGFAFPELFLFWRFVKLLPGVDSRQLGFVFIFLLILVLQIL